MPAINDQITDSKLHAFSRDVMNFAPKVIHHFKEIQKEGELLYTDSLTTELEIRRVPLKPDDTHPALTHEQQMVVRSQPDAAKNLVCIGLDQSNVGSNVGLLTVMKKIHDHRNKADEENKWPARYITLTADLNIFVRMAKVG